ncbi:MAG: hypothetical protein CVU73_07860 [Deltaproteobacteria bacterium HGW-Deltaproteobacteria-8]|jgi:hypothetical protein|nr:MAG: hypothetical protein CVU73_07860 [Deltaproteobacteria bacterium HGW-Deltaproteobacteria-8]
MAHEMTKKQAVMRMIGFGAASAAVFGAIFHFANPITEIFSRGGFYAALPIATVFLVSYVHGSFASNLWTALGINAKQPAKTLQPTAAKRPEVRATLNA